MCLTRPRHDIARKTNWRVLDVGLLAWIWPWLYATYSNAEVPAHHLAIKQPSQTIVVDGLLNDPVWDTVSPLDIIHSPWSERPARKTVFKAIASRERFYFSFVADDDEITLHEPFADEIGVDHEDRVEIFFSCDKQLRDYYCLEIDPRGRVHDYRARYYREFDHEWGFETLAVAASCDAEQYVVEAAIDLGELRRLGLAQSEWIVGLYRAELRHDEHKITDYHWTCWVDPLTQSPEFHVPTSFGRFVIHAELGVENNANQ